MKKLPVQLGTAARWLAVAALCAAPTFIRYELTSEATFACTRDGKLAGTCHAEATLRQTIGLDRSWNVGDPDAAPRPWFMPATRIDDIGMATPSGGDHYLRLHGSPSCWSNVMPSGYSNCVFAHDRALRNPAR